MKPYEMQTELSGPIAQYAKDIKDFTEEKLHNVAFTAKRVKMGIYQERKGNTYMCRIRCSANIVTPAQLEVLANLANIFGDSRIHITTRAEIQIHGIALEDTIEVLKKLAAAGLSSIGGGGHTIRNIITNHDSGVHPKEEFDVQPYALALANQMLDESDSLNLPRKVKIGFSSLPHHHDFCLTQDIGFVAVKNNGGKHGFKVYAGGGLGAKPHIGFCLRDFIPVGHTYPVVKAIKNVYHRYGNRKNKHHSRLRFLIFDDLGKEKFKSLFLL
ncbi:MAG: nitrite/sulfite reductase [Deltaproteobacteria bacterium]|nr:nitrite/sulfite reductase [Deltaproteobacteria bacterium]